MYICTGVYIVHITEASDALTRGAKIIFLHTREDYRGRKSYLIDEVVMLKCRHHNMPHHSVFRILGAFFKQKNAVFNDEQDKIIHYSCEGGIEKSSPS